MSCRRDSLTRDGEGVFWIRVKVECRLYSVGHVTCSGPSLRTTSTVDKVSWGWKDLPCTWSHPLLRFKTPIYENAPFYHLKSAFHFYVRKDM